MRTRRSTKCSRRTTSWSWSSCTYGWMLQFDLASPRLQAHPGDRGGGGEHGLEAGIAMNSMLITGFAGCGACSEGRRGMGHPQTEC
ncbi:Os06g0181900 [Oryza sativa Japonica Group]|uniref:Os06g0181900 protein n=1 Tax=Oryza sativa subsp. japonica TaxID=39947 RepID=Q0DE27_ORYSJ|nr:Os06g0181900 [Oryza sativa Japonica Group]|eukprot:NP_001056982.1 Os06g0181900 [Oryza sativa Japonica Group]